MVNTRTNSVTPVFTMEALQETMNEIKYALLTLTGQVNDHTLHFRVFQTKLARLSNREGTSGGNNNRKSNGRQGSNQMVQYGRISKIEFPKFNGDDVKGWIFKCRQLFRIDNVLDKMKVELAAMHVYDRALTWHQQVVKRYGAWCTWELYEQEALSRFGAVFEDPMVELKNLKQTSTVKSYQDQFESLLNKVDLLESYAISLFVGGLKDESSMSIRMFKLTTLAGVFSIARMQEATNNAMKPMYTPTQSKYKLNNVRGAYKGTGLLPKPTTIPLALPTPTQTSNGERFTNTPFRKQLTQKELEEKSAKNQCFYCDQRYSLGHKCSGQSIQGQDYSCDAMLLHLGGCEMVVGIQWLSTLGDIMWNFKNLTMEFELLVPNTLLSISDLIDTSKPDDAIGSDGQRIDGFRVEEHCAHLQQVLEVMRHNKLFAKQSKCSFAVKKVEYLRHEITGERVATNPSKIKAIKN
ncbi:reverse transcriptase [Tanacetum coccineum]